MKYSPKFILYSLIVFLLILMLSIVIYANVKIIGYKEYEVDYFVGDYIGINLDEDAIHFGTGSPGMNLRREITVSSDVDIIVKLIPLGIDYMSVSDNNFLVLSGEKKSVGLKIELPLNIPKGSYSGKIKVLYLKP